MVYMLGQIYDCMVYMFGQSYDCIHAWSEL